MFSQICGRLLVDGDLDSLVGDDALKPLVLGFELSQPFGLIGLHVAVLLLPPVTGLLTDVELLDDRTDHLFPPRPSSRHHATR